MTLHHKRKKGFTLIEVLLASALFAAVSMMTMATISQIAAFQYKAAEARQTAQAAREFADIFTRSVREARGDIKLSANPAGAIYSQGIMLLACDASGCASNINYDTPRQSSANTLITFSKDSYKIFIFSDDGLYYSSGSNPLVDINNNATGAGLNSTIHDILANSGKRISKSGHAIVGSFNGYAPRDDAANKQQPYVEFSVTAETKDYDSVSPNQRAMSTIISTVTSRKYD